VDDAIKALLRASVSPADVASALDGREVSTGDVTLGPRGLTSGGRVIATVGTVVREIARRDVETIRGRTRRGPSAVAGIALIVAGAGMVVLNAIGLSNDTSVPPGSPRDGYLGLPGVLIGGGLVVTGGVLLHRARATRVVYRRSER
jgi:hypothetical protein